MSPQIKNSDFRAYSYFDVASNPHRNLLKSPGGAPYKFNIIKMSVFVYSWIARILKSCPFRSISFVETLIFLNENRHRCLLKGLSAGAGT